MHCWRSWPFSERRRWPLLWLCWMGCATAAPAVSTPSATTFPTEDGPQDHHASGEALDPEALRLALEGKGLEGWMHAVVPQREQWVLTVRDETDFFSFVEIALVPADDGVRNALVELERHDRVSIRGALSQRGGQLHARVDAVSRLEPYTEYAREDVAAGEVLPTSGRVTVKVHAVDPTLVVEWGEIVVPVRTPKASNLAERLYRGDIVELSVHSGARPDHPVHWELHPEDLDSIRIVQAIRSGHGEPATVEGTLVRFPKSPQIRFPVFAVQTSPGFGLSLDYTLVNFEDPDLFVALREKLERVWNEHVQAAVPGRNRFVNPRLRVRAKGTKNVVAPQQANPQILVEALEDVEIVVEEAPGEG